MLTWLTATNAGAEEIWRAALRHQGISEADLAGGFVCDPQTKARLRILTRTGIILRLSRNLDKKCGVVNGALAEVVVSVQGSVVFVARLVVSGNYVLIHAMQEGGTVFCHAATGMPPRSDVRRALLCTWAAFTSTSAGILRSVATGMWP